MFAVIFEVQPKAGKFNDYLDLAKFLKPKLEAIEGFIDNERFESKRTKGRVLSLSTWADEKAVIRWRTQGEHHGVQEKGRFEVFEDYHLRVGEISADTGPPKGIAVREQRFDATEIGEAKVVTITELEPREKGTLGAAADQLGAHLGLRAGTDGLIDKRYSIAFTIPASCCCSRAGGMPRLPRHGRQRNPSRPRRCATAGFASSVTTGCSIAARRRSSIPT
jgi:heme-degrading monooxygenase HmoA